MGVKIFWNWQGCTYSGRCYLQEETEKHQPKPCSYNPKMFTCIAYQEFEMWNEREEEKREIDERKITLRFLVSKNLNSLYPVRYYGRG